MQVADTGAAKSIRDVYIEVDCGVPRSSVADYKTRYAETLYGWWFHVLFSDSTNLFMFGRRNIRRYVDTGAWARRWALLRRWYSGTLKNALGFDIPIVRHDREVN